MRRPLLLRLAIAAAVATPSFVLAQQSSVGTANTDDNDQAMRNIQSNFAHITPPPRTIETINQELKQSRASAFAAGTAQRGGGRNGRRSQNRSEPTNGQDPAPGTASVPDNAAAQATQPASISGE
ncbi:hypothetical protein [Cupriavidus sp. RAF12]|uniref:hypothetical protein n=1 Tax=Cupriavidus sp. RAF12 TaxID=3233050 RepID=UPI003F8F7535